MSEPSLDQIVGDAETWGTIDTADLRALIASWRERGEALKPFVRALDALEAVSDSYPNDMAILRASFDYYTRHLGFNNDEIVERDSVRLSDLRRARAALKDKP